MSKDILAILLSDEVAALVDDLDLILQPSSAVSF